VVQRLAIDYATLSKDNPGLVYLSISGFGQSGPRARARAYDPIIQTYSGMASVQGRIHHEHPDRPEQVNMLLLDKLTAWTGCQAITAALLARSRSGQGQLIELSMLDTAIAFAWSDAAADLILQATDNVDKRPPIGASGQLLEYADGWGATMTLSQQEFRGLCLAYELPEIADDPRFNTLQARIAHREELREVISSAFAAQAAKLSIAEARRRFAEHEVPFGVVQSLHELPQDPQVQHNATLRHVDHPIAGPLLEARPAPIFRGTPLQASAPAPTPGQHTAEILAELGMAEQYQQLTKAGIVM
jgi:crotonobetainyl-CoA:carnitine CoA-transferase CaiB-like acyl-CoA transferase